MRAKLILTNWVLSIMGTSVDVEQSPIWAVLLPIGWFAVSSLLLIYADKQGWMKDIVKRYKSDEL